MAPTTDESPLDEHVLDDGKVAPATRGRRRDDGRTDAIVEAAGALLLEIGFDRLRIQDVAERAGCGTGAIYRRWTTKEALVADAIMAFPESDPDPTDDPVADLRTLLRQKITLPVDTPDLLTGAVGAMRSDERVAEAMRARSDDGVYRRTIARVIGDDHPHLDLLASVPPGVVLHRVAFQGGIDDIETLVEEIIALVLSLRDQR